MALNKRELHPDDRDTLTAIIDAKLADCDMDDKRAAPLVYDAVVAAGGALLMVLQRQALASELQRECKAHAKASSTVLVDYEGRLVMKDSRRAVRVLDKDSGRIYEQQKLLTDMTWQEFSQWRERNSVAERALEMNESMAAQLAKLHVMYPETKTVGAALKAHGMNLQTFLNSEAATA